MTLVIDAHVGLKWFIEESWLCKPITRRTNNVAAVALANKNARIIWALLTKKLDFITITLRTQQLQLNDRDG